MKGLNQYQDDVNTIRRALTAAGVYEQHRDLLHRLDAFGLAVENAETATSETDCTHSRVTIDRATGTETCEDCGQENPTEVAPHISPDNQLPCTRCGAADHTARSHRETEKGSL